jgi:protein-S-isoprenylcysteine O-methyltransferase Ste14
VLFGAIAWLGYADLRDHGPANPWGPIATLSGLAGIAAGGFVAVRGAWDLRASFSPFPRPLEGAALVESGVYRLIRHPIYSGLVLAAVGWATVASSALTIAAGGVLFLLFAGKSRREEAWLALAHPGYADYQRRTRRMIPWVY